MNISNTVYIVVEIDDSLVGTNRFKPFIACTTLEEAKRYSSPLRQIFGPIPLHGLPSNPFEPFVPHHKPEPMYLPRFDPEYRPNFPDPRVPRGPFAGFDPNPDTDFNIPRKRLPRHPDSSFGGHSNE